MRYIHSGEVFTTGEVKPLERLLAYRERCLALTRDALETGAQSRTRCPGCGAEAEPAQLPHRIPYRRCRSCGAFFMAAVPSLEQWAGVCERAAALLYVPSGPDDETVRQRREHVYVPKAAWIAQSLKLFGAGSGAALVFAPIQPAFSQAMAEHAPELPLRQADEAALAGAFARLDGHEPDARARLMGEALECGAVRAAILLEGLDRARDPRRLLEAVAAALPKGGLVFLTALMASGFELRVLGAQCRYLFPPDKANCFPIQTIERLVERAGFELVESSTPGVLDCDSVLQHIRSGVAVPCSPFEEAVLAADDEGRRAFQEFLQFSRLSSFGRFVGRRR